MKRIGFLIVSLVIFLVAGNADAGNFGIGVHSGYGTIKYEEETSALGDEIKSEAVLNTILFGISAEYSFTKQKNLFAGIVTDWAFGLEDEEKWKENGIRSQTNDIRIFGQFYDFRFGYKNSYERLYYRIYAAGGWDGIHFERDKFISRGISISGNVTEDFSLWRVGGGAGLGYKFGKWALDGRAVYAYYPYAEVENSSLPGVEFDTNGICLDFGIGLAREISRNMNFYFGGSYTGIKLEESDIERQAVFPESKTQIIVGVVNLTYAF